MHTRSAAKREAGALPPPSALQSPLVILTQNTTSSKEINERDDEKIENCNTNAKKRKRSTNARQKQNIVEPVIGDWDTLPHGLGKIGNSAQDAGQQLVRSNEMNTTAISTKRPKVEGATNIKEEALASLEIASNQAPSGGQSADGKKKPGRKVKKEELDLEQAKNVIEKVDEMVNATKAPKQKRTKKTNEYGLTPGISPFPNHSMPTPEACEEVNTLLSGLHGEVIAPEVVPQPSLTVTGCGEVPDVLDALMRTLLSASTTANNANLAMSGLKEKFGLREKGAGKGSVDWEVVFHSDITTLRDAIKRGGSQNIKGKHIRGILDIVHAKNSARLEELREQEQILKAESGDSDHKAQIEYEINKLEENIFCMDYIFGMSTEDAMDEMLKLPGIGVKTSACVLLFCLKRPSFAVDTHVWRHCKWLGWVPERADRDKTFSHCEVRIPDHLKYSLHQLFVRHGKTCRRCKAGTSPGSKEWDETVCPIEHLVNRKKERVSGASKDAKSKAKPNKRKGKDNFSTDESDPELMLSDE